MSTFNESDKIMKMVVDELISETISVYDQQGRDTNTNKYIGNLIDRLAKIRKKVDRSDLESCLQYLNELNAIYVEITDGPLESNVNDGFLEIGEQCVLRLQYYAEQVETIKDDQHKGDIYALSTKNIYQGLMANIRQLEYIMISFMASQIGIIDCCFADKFIIQNNGDTITSGYPIEMIVYPQKSGTRWEYSSYDYHNIKVTKNGETVNVKVDKRKIGHALMLMFKVHDPGDYLVHISITEDSEFLEEAWSQEIVSPVQVLLSE